MSRQPDGTLLITGGAGFIGANLVHQLLADSSHDLVVIDKMTYAANPLTLDSWKNEPRVSFMRADIGDAAAMQQLFSAHAPVAVYNLAAETHVDRSIDSPEAFIRTNTSAPPCSSRPRAGIAQRSRVARARHFDSCTCRPMKCMDRSTPAGVSRKRRRYAPNSPYAASKAAADHLVRAYFHTYGLPVLITNCSNNYGPFQLPEKLIPLTMLNALEGRRLPIYGDGSNVRDWLHVKDHCAGLMTVMQRGRAVKHYSLGAENEQNNVAIVDTICDVLEQLRPAKDNPALQAAGAARYADLKTFVADRPGHDRRYAIDPAKVRTELGWTPRHDFRQGLTDTARWYLEHQHWYAASRIGYDRQRLGLGASMPEAMSAEWSGIILAGGSGSRLHPLTRASASSCCRSTTSR